MTFQSRPVGRRSKLSADYTALLAGEEPWDRSQSFSSPTSPSASSSRPSLSHSSSSYIGSGKSRAAPRARFYADLLCLPPRPEAHIIADLLNAITARILLDDDPASKGARIRSNVGALWREALRVWRERDEDVGEERRSNAIETLIALSGPILAKRLLPFDLISVFAGSMDEADDVFGSLVAGIDESLRGDQVQRPRMTFASSFTDDGTLPSRQSAASLPTEANSEQQRRVLHLALLWLSHVSQTSLGAYFLRRDLFLAGSAFLSAVGHRNEPVALDVELLFGLLATLGQGGAGGAAGSSGGIGASTSSGAASSNPYARRLRDWVDEPNMERLCTAASRACETTIQSYVAVSDDTPPSIGGALADIASLRWMSGLGGLVGLGAGGVKSDASPSGTAPSGFANLPPPAIAVALPLFLLIRANQAFVSILFRIPSIPQAPAATATATSSNTDAIPPPALQVTILSLSTYVLTHASTTPRSRAYARLTLLLLCALAWDPSGAKALLDSSEASGALLAQVRICRQKAPPLPLPSRPRTRLLTAVLDAATVFLRHNLSKRLDVGSHIVALRLVQRGISMCASSRVQLEYDWAETWRALVGLANFIVTRHAEMKLLTADVGELVRVMIDTLGTALVQSDRYLPSTADTHALIYELVRASATLHRIMLFLSPSPAGSGGAGSVMSPVTASFSIPSTPADSTPPTPTELSGSGSTLRQLPTEPLPPIPPRLFALVPAWRALSAVLTASQTHLDSWAASQSARTARRGPDVKTVMGIVARLDLETLLAGAEDNERGGDANVDSSWLDREEERSLHEAARWACEDVRRLQPP